MISRFRFLAFLATLILVTPETSGAQETSRVDCPVTPYAEEGLAHPFTTTWYGSNDFWVGPAPSYRGIWYAGGEGMKVQWQRPGTELAVKGRRLDATAPPLQANVTPGYDLFPYQFSRLLFPTEGCWEVTGRIPDQEIQFVVWVHPETDDPYVTNPPTPAPDTWDELRRPLDIPSLQPGETCPVSKPRQISRVAGTVLGEGSIYAQGLGTNGEIPLGGVPMRGDAFSIPIRWIASPEAPGPFLIRGLRLDTSETLLFGDTESQPEMQIWDITSQGSPDWQVWQFGNLRLPGPGCYGLQIDGMGFSDVIVFAATDEIAPEVTTSGP